MRKFCLTNGRAFRPRADKAALSKLATELLGVLKDPDREALKRIARNPLLLTLTTALYCKDGPSALPRDRAGLYGVCLEALLRRWEEKLEHDDPSKSYSIHDTTLGRDELHAALDHLGYRAHLGLTGAGAAEREHDDLTGDAIAEAFSPRLREGYGNQHVIDYLQNSTGLIVARDQAKFAFIHRSFREYLAARYVTRTDSIRDWTDFAAACRADAGWWREVVAMGARMGDKNESPPMTTALLTHLLPYGPSELPARSDEDWLLAELTAHGEAERDADATHPSARAAVRSRCVGWLVALVEDDALGRSPDQREQAAITLGRLGDPRKGVGLDPEFPELPDIDWVEIAAGKVTLEENNREFPIAHPFRIARYPVTNRQFQTFVDDPEGHRNRTWWAGFESKHRDPEPSRWPEPNHPRTDVSWYEALAYCRWLTAKSRACGRIEPDWEIRLPTEWEWQQAATGCDPANVFPWGPKYEAGRANVEKDSLGRTNAVGLYRRGASPQGVHDLAGNIWEWCLNKYDSPEKTSADNYDDWRVLRGGAWCLPASYARAAFRGLNRSDSRYVVGFRLCCSPPSAGTDH
ncbi:MAG: formylglycine-generating enzyme family protein [Gammaproteobacteria bacterium]